ncbi:hypothetical protein VPHK567_0280 [Vibrio phage K567]|nr:hypothetical protein MYOV011v1_p0344 [Vibrio phage 6E35.1a]
MKRAFIEAGIGGMSLVGVHGEYPYGHGNYCTNTQGYYFTNIWAENLEHVRDVLNLLPDGKIEVLLFRGESKTNYVYAYVIDERVPKEALHAPYFCGIKTNTDIIRHHYDIPDDKCLCDFDDLKLLSFRSSNNKGRIKASCYECDTVFEFQRVRATGVYRVQKATDDGWNRWVLAWFDDGTFRQLPDMVELFPSDIIKVDVERVHEFGSGAEQSGAVAVDDFLFNGIVSKDVKQL